MARVLAVALAASSSLQLAASSRPVCFSPSSSTSIGGALPVPRSGGSSLLSPRRLTPPRLGSGLFGINAPWLIRKEENNGIEASASGSIMVQGSAGVRQEGALEWAKQDRRRLLHVVYRVSDLDKTIKFYRECLGMKLLRKRDIPEERYTDAFLGYGYEDSHFVVELTYDYGVEKYDIGTGFGHFGIAVEDYTIAMMGYGPEDKNAVLELTYNYGVKEYDKGNGYAQIAIGTDDVYKTAEAIKLSGGKVTREPGRLPGTSTKITACLDPDGWKTVFVDNIDFTEELE